MNKLFHLNTLEWGFHLLTGPCADPSWIDPSLSSYFATSDCAKSAANGPACSLIVACSATACRHVFCARSAALMLLEFAEAKTHMLDQSFQRAVRDIAALASHVASNDDVSYNLQAGVLLADRPQIGPF